MLLQMLLISSLKGCCQAKKVETSSEGCSEMLCCLDLYKVSMEILVQQVSLGHPEWPIKCCKDNSHFWHLEMSWTYPTISKWHLCKSEARYKKILDNRTLLAFRPSKCLSKAYLNIFCLKNHNYTWSSKFRNS